jgi:phosphinothricin acetyltransferase
MEYQIEPMRDDDWPAVRAIYLAGIAQGQATFEMTAPSWEDWDAGHLSLGRLVARGPSGVLGWVSLSPVSRRAVYVGVAENSVYISQETRGQGIGRALMSALIAVSEQVGIWMLQTSIFPENAASLALHERCGFRVVGRRERIGRQYGVWRDTLLLERRSAVVGVE